MISRVHYLAREERKFLRKIENSRGSAVKMQKLKEDKITSLQDRLDKEKQERN